RLPAVRGDRGARSGGRAVPDDAGPARPDPGRLTSSVSAKTHVRQTQEHDERGARADRLAAHGGGAVLGRTRRTGSAGRAGAGAAGRGRAVPVASAEPAAAGRPAARDGRAVLAVRSGAPLRAAPAPAGP